MEQRKPMEKRNIYPNYDESRNFSPSNRFKSNQVLLVPCSYQATMIKLLIDQSKTPENCMKNSRNTQKRMKKARKLKNAVHRFRAPEPKKGGVLVWRDLLISRPSKKNLKKTKFFFATSGTFLFGVAVKL